MSDNPSSKIQHSVNAGDNSTFFRSLAQEFIAEPHPSAELHPLRRQVRQALRTLKNTGRHPAQGGPDADGIQAGFREWLDDNYHLFMREGSSLLAALRFADRQPCIDRLPATFLMLLKLVKKSAYPKRTCLRSLSKPSSAYARLRFSSWSSFRCVCAPPFL